MVGLDLRKLSDSDLYKRRERARRVLEKLKVYGERIFRNVIRKEEIILDEVKKYNSSLSRKKRVMGYLESICDEKERRESVRVDAYLNGN